MLVKLLLVLLAIYRLLIAFAIELPLAAKWPVSNLNSQCAAVCPTAWQSQYCFKHCELRQKYQLDLADYEKVDPLFKNITSTFIQQINMYILLGVSVLILFVALGSLFGSRHAKRWGLVAAGILGVLVVPYCVELFYASPDAQKAILYNAGDLVLILVLLLNGMTGDHYVANVAQNAVAAAKKKN